MPGLTLFWSAIFHTAKLSTVFQILLFLPLTLSTLSTNAFLLHSLLIFAHSLIHGSLFLFWKTPALSVMQVPMHSFLLLLSFNIFSQEVHPFLNLAAGWWGKILNLSSPGFIILESLSSLVVAQKLGQVGKELVGEGEGQFGLLIASAATYVISAWWIVWSYSYAATSPLSSTLLGVALTAFIFLTLIGFGLRRTNVIESSGLALFLAYNFWLCGFDSDDSFTDSSSYVPLLGNILPHIQNLINFITNTLPKPVLTALLYRLLILHFASQILPTIGADTWQAEAGVDDTSWSDRPTSALARLLFAYRQSIMIMVYSHLLLLDHSSQVWWRWMSVFVTLILWAIELLVSSDDDPVAKEWKVD